MVFCYVQFLYNYLVLKARTSQNRFSLAATSLKISPKNEMRKILLISSILIGGIIIAQSKKIDKIYSTKELISIQNSISENEKKEFYIQFFKANLFENIKAKFTSKKYSDALLKKFADTIISAHNWGADEKFEPEKIKKKS